MSAVATCYILDVGMQAGRHSGSSNVIIFPRSRGPRFPHAVVIDCGDRAETTIRLLQNHRVAYVDHIFITHNDRDHSGGLSDLINAFRRRVGLIWFLLDRKQPIPFYRELKRLRDEKAFEGERFLLADDEAVRRLFTSLPQDDAGTNWSIDLIYPLSVEDVMDPQISGDPNAASAVLLLHCGEDDHQGRILFPGDARIETLRRAREYFSKPDQPPRPIHCDILVTPHHGGAVRRGSRLTREQYKALFREVVQCHFAVVSVATNNQDGHPHEEHIVALSSASDSVLCTQITRQCCEDPRSLQPGVVPPFPGVPQASQASDGARGVACAGTVVVDIGPFPLEPRRWEDHRREVDQLHQRNTAEGRLAPLCRRHAAEQSKTALSLLP